ncbi:MAG: hypothetical protein H6642_06130 [Caldilineaceae bacterium]|nr:hypothetical protein [Caldilineaceae bacterium]
MDALGRIAFAAVGFALIVGILLLVWRNPQPEVVAVDNFIDALAKQDFTQAYALLDDDLQLYYRTPAGLETDVRDRQFHPVTWNARQDVSSRDYRYDAVTVRVKLSDGRTVISRFSVRSNSEKQLRISSIRF